MELGDEYAEFEIPYLLEVKDSIKENEDWRFQTSVNGYQAEIRCRKQTAEEKNSPFPDFVIADSKGNVCSTLIQVWFGQNFLQSLRRARKNLDFEIEGVSFYSTSPDSYDQYLLGYAIEFINELLGVYRVSTENHWIQKLSLEEIGTIELTKSIDTGELDTRLYFVSGKQVQRDNADPTLRDHIQDALGDENSVNRFQQIRLEIKDNIRRHEYDNAVMYSVRLFEVWAKTSYIALESLKKDKKEEPRRIAKETPFVPFIEQNLNSHMEADITQYQEWKTWKNDTYEVRKETIHEGRQVREQTAQSSFIQTKRLIARLAYEFEDELGELPLFPDVNGT